MTLEQDVANTSEGDVEVDPAVDKQKQVWYAPVGVPLGPWRPRQEMIFGIRRGATFYELDTEEFQIWISALTAPTTVELAKNTTDIATGKLADAIRRLRQEGLLCRVGDSDELDDHFLRQHKLLGMGFGLGQIQDRAECSIAGSDMVPRITVDPLIYTIWIGVGGNTSMWETCKAVAEVVEQPLHSVVARFLDALPFLIRSGVTLIDLV